MTLLLIGDTAVPSADAATIDVIDPCDDTVLDAIPAGCPADADAAVAVAVKAAAGWGPPRQRNGLPCSRRRLAG